MYGTSLNALRTSKRTKLAMYSVYVYLQARIELTQKLKFIYLLFCKEMNGQHSPITVHQR